MANTLSAWRVSAYGGPAVLEPVTAPMPQPGPKDILIRIRASAVTRADTLMRAGRPLFARPFLGWSRPRAGLSGTGFSGEVLGVGPDVTRFSVGDAVFGEAGLAFGANATHICLNENGVVMRKPDGIPHEDAAVLCDGPLTSWHFLTRMAPVKAGDHVLVLGGAGSLGSAAVQIARALGAEVSATTSQRNATLVADLGADHVLDYAQVDPFQTGADYDVIYDTVQAASFAAAKPALAPGGRYICPILSLGLLRAVLMSLLWGSNRAGFAAVGLETPEVLRGHLGHILDHIAGGDLTLLMDRTYPLSDMVDAHAYVDAGHKRGNVVAV